MKLSRRPTNAPKMSLDLMGECRVQETAGAVACTGRRRRSIAISTRLTRSNSCVVPSNVQNLPKLAQNGAVR